jgi:hypothetical protein
LQTLADNDKLLTNISSLNVAYVSLTAELNTTQAEYNLLNSSYEILNANNALLNSSYDDILRAHYNLAETMML